MGYAPPKPTDLAFWSIRAADQRIGDADLFGLLGKASCDLLRLTGTILEPVTQERDCVQP
jgi:hypothetical protein